MDDLRVASSNPPGVLIRIKSSAAFSGLRLIDGMSYDLRGDGVDLAINGYGDDIGSGVLGKRGRRTEEGEYAKRSQSTFTIAFLFALHQPLLQPLDGGIELAIDRLTLSSRLLLQAFALSIVFLADALEFSVFLLAEALRGFILACIDAR